MTAPLLFPLGEPWPTGLASDLPLDFRARDLNVYGTLRGTPAFTRAGKATTRDARGRWYEAVHSQSRFDYVEIFGDDVGETDSLDFPVLCLDGARTNLVPYGADLSQWTAVNAPAVTVDYDRAGLMGFTRVQDDSGTLNEYIRTPNLAARVGTNGNGVLLFYVAQEPVSAANGPSVVIRDITAGADRGRVRWTWSGGQPTFTPTGCTILWSRHAGYTEGGRAYYEVAVKASGTLTTSDLQLYVNGADTAAQQGDALVGWFDVQDRSTAPLPITRNTGASSASSLADTWSIPFNAPTDKGLHFLLDLLTHGGIRHQVGAKLMTLGNDANANPQFYLDVVSGGFRVVHHNGSSSVSSTVTVNPGDAARVQLLGALGSSGFVALKCRYRVAFAAANVWTYATDGAASAALAQAAWASPTKVYLGHPYTNAQALRVVTARVALGTGTWTTAEAEV